MKKGALIALLALATSVAVYAEGGKKKKAKKEKAKIECCSKSKCSNDENPNCCLGQPTSGTKNN